MTEQFHSDIQPGETSAACPQRVPEISTHNSQQLQTNQCPLSCVLVLRNELTKYTVWTEPLGHSTGGERLSVVSPAYLPGWVLRRPWVMVNLATLYTAQATDPPGVMGMKKVCEHRHRYRKAGIWWAMPFGLLAMAGLISVTTVTELFS